MPPSDEGAGARRALSIAYTQVFDVSVTLPGIRYVHTWLETSVNLGALG